MLFFILIIFVATSGVVSSPSLFYKTTLSNNIEKVFATNDNEGAVEEEQGQEQPQQDGTFLTAPPVVDGEATLGTAEEGTLGTECGPNQVWTGDQCETQCAPGEVLNEGNQCEKVICAEDEFWNGNQCEKIMPCAPDQDWIDGQCVTMSNEEGTLETAPAEPVEEPPMEVQCGPDQVRNAENQCETVASEEGTLGTAVDYEYRLHPSRRSI